MNRLLLSLFMFLSLPLASEASTGLTVVVDEHAIFNPHDVNPNRYEKTRYGQFRHGAREFLSALRTLGYSITLIPLVQYHPEGPSFSARLSNESFFKGGNYDQLIEKPRFLRTLNYSSLIRLDHPPEKFFNHFEMGASQKIFEDLKRLRDALTGSHSHWSTLLSSPLPSEVAKDPSRSQETYLDRIRFSLMHSDSELSVFFDYVEQEHPRLYQSLHLEAAPHSRLFPHYDDKFDLSLNGFEPEHTLIIGNVGYATRRDVKNWIYFANEDFLKRSPSMQKLYDAALQDLGESSESWKSNYEKKASLRYYAYLLGWLKELQASNLPISEVLGQIYEKDPALGMTYREPALATIKQRIASGFMVLESDRPEAFSGLMARTFDSNSGMRLIAASRHLICAQSLATEK